jgi:hypothetical protein
MGVSAAPHSSKIRGAAVDIRLMPPARPNPAARRRLNCFTSGSVGGYTTMHLFKPQMNSTEFNAALREAGFGVDHARIVDVSGKCPGFAALASFNKGAINRNATLTKVIRERDVEIGRRATAEPAA